MSGYSSYCKLRKSTSQGLSYLATFSVLAEEAKDKHTELKSIQDRAIGLRRNSISMPSLTTDDLQALHQARIDAEESNILVSFFFALYINHAGCLSSVTLRVLIQCCSIVIDCFVSCLIR